MSTSIDFQKQSRNALYVGVGGLAVAAFGLFSGLQSGDARPVIGWLIGGTFWLSILIGMLMLTLISYIFDAGWLTILRRQLEHGLAAFKWVGLFFLPLALVILIAPHAHGLPWIWMNPENLIPGGHTVGHDPLYIAKQGYLNVPFFLIRGIVYFAIWIGLAHILRKHSIQMDTDRDPKHTHTAYKWSCVGTPLAAFAFTFFAFDWLKSLEYHWFSTMYGVWFFAACIRAALSMLVIIAIFQSTRSLKGLYKDGHSYLIGCLILAFTIFWAYISFCQYFLQYNANIPEEIFWYSMREVTNVGGVLVKNSWWWVSMALVFMHFVFPFLYLLRYKNKFGNWLLFIAVWILSVHLIDLYWNILPQKLYDAEHEYSVRPFIPHFSEIAAIIGLGGICIWAYLKSAMTTQLVPFADPRIVEAVNCHE
jgi:hypothetical protein